MLPLWDGIGKDKKEIMNNVALRRSTVEDLEKILPIYDESFPDDEKKPYSMIIENHLSGKGEMLSVISDGEVVGMMFACFYLDYAMIDYFAIDKSRRGERIGERAMALCAEHYKNKKIYLEIEDPSIGEMAARRLNFYLRCGFREMGVEINLFGVDMILLALGDFKVEFSDYFGLYVHMTNESFAKKHVKLREQAVPEA